MYVKRCDNAGVRYQRPSFNALHVRVCRSEKARETLKQQFDDVWESKKLLEVRRMYMSSAACVSRSNAVCSHCATYFSSF